MTSNLRTASSRRGRDRGAGWSLLGWLGFAGSVLLLAGCVPLVAPEYPPPGPRQEPTAPPLPRPPRSEPRLRLMPTSLDFGVVEVGSSASLDVRMRNDGDAEAWVSRVAVDGDGFRMTGTSCERKAVRPGESCSVQVRFVPGSEGAHRGAAELLLPDLGRRLSVPLSGEGMDRGGPRVAVTPVRLAFNRDRTLDVAVRNEGPSELRLRDAVVNGRGFELAAENCSGRALAPGRSCTVSVRFSSEGRGGSTGALTLLSNDPERPRLVVPLTGEGDRRDLPDARIEPATLDFGRVPEGKDRSLDLAVRNDGRAELRVREVGINGKGFALSYDACSRSVLPPGRSCLATVRFSALETGVQVGTVTVLSDDPDQSRLSVALRGEGERRGRPEARVEPPRLDYGRLEEGVVRTLEAAVRNEGRADLRIDDVRLEGRGFELQRDGCSGQIVAPSRSCSLSVRFSAQGTGPREGTLSVRTDDPGHRRLDVALAGEVERRSRPVIRVSPERLDFGPLEIGQRRVLDLEVKNEGRGELRMREASVEGRGFREARDECSGRAIPPGRSCAVSVEFAPDGNGPATGSVRVVSNDPDPARLQVALAGTGVGRATGPKPCRSVRLDPLEGDGAVLELDWAKGECATYAVAVGQGVLFVRTPDGYRLEGDGFQAAERGPSKPKVGRSGPGRVQRLRVRRPSDVTFTLTRGDGPPGRAQLVLEWVSKDTEDRRGD